MMWHLVVRSLSSPARELCPVQCQLLNELQPCRSSQPDKERKTLIPVTHGECVEGCPKQKVLSVKVSRLLKREGTRKGNVKDKQVLDPWTGEKRQAAERMGPETGQCGACIRTTNDTFI